MEDNSEVIGRIQWAIEAAKASVAPGAGWEAKSRIENIGIHLNGYAEPGYEDPVAILVGNWNSVTRWSDGDIEVVDNTMGRLVKIFEMLGCEIEWCDQWTGCDECSRLIRTGADGYEWRPYYHSEGDQTTCSDCLDQEEYLEGIECDSNAINQMFDPEENGYVLVADDFENGWHRGQDASPALIGGLMDEAGISRWLFSLDGKGQFDIKFSLWIHKEVAEQCDGEGIILAKRVIEQGNTNGPSVAAAMARMLKESARQSDELAKSGPPGIIVSTISDSGVETKVVSVEDFVEGRALD